MYAYLTNFDDKIIVVIGKWKSKTSSGYQDSTPNVWYHSTYENKSYMNNVAHIDIMFSSD